MVAARAIAVEVQERGEAGSWFRDRYRVFEGRGGVLKQSISRHTRNRGLAGRVVNILNLGDLAFFKTFEGATTVALARALQWSHSPIETPPGTHATRRTGTCTAP